jgi:hypothetical protein
VARRIGGKIENPLAEGGKEKKSSSKRRCLRRARKKNRAVKDGENKNGRIPCKRTFTVSGF